MSTGQLGICNARLEVAYRQHATFNGTIILLILLILRISQNYLSNFLTVTGALARRKHSIPYGRDNWYAVTRTRDSGTTQIGHSWDWIEVAGRGADCTPASLLGLLLRPPPFSHLS